MKFYRKENREVTVLDKVICDFCGKECPKKFDNFHYAYICPDFGYGSRFDEISEDNIEKSIMCEDCFEKIQQLSFKLKETDNV